MLFWLIPTLASAVVLLSSLNSTQTTAWWGTSILLPRLSSPFILVELAVDKYGVPVLLTASANFPAIATFDPSQGLHTDALASDLVSFAYRSITCYLTLNSSAFPDASTLEIGILMPDLQSPAGIRLQVRAHSDLYSGGDLCPNDCNGHGRCEAGKCVCRDYFVGEDCAFETSQVVVNQQADLMVPAYAYSLLQVYYDSGRNLGMSVQVVQGEIVLLVAFGL